MEQKYTAYISKDASKHEKQVILLKISNEEGWHCLAVKKLSALLIGITPKNVGDFYCLSFLQLFRRSNKLESHKKYVKIFVVL